MDSDRIIEIFRQFGTGYNVQSFEELNTGHINKTFLVKSHSGRQFVLQRLNPDVFKDSLKMGYNLKRLDSIFRRKKEQYPYVFPKIHFPQEFMPLLRNGGKYWRLMDYIGNSAAFNIPLNTETAFEGAKAFGAFQRVLLDETTNSFYTTIMSFRNLNMRMRSLKSAVRRDAKKRKKEADPEINKIIGWEDINAENHKLIKSGKLKKVICHNDTKPDNVLFDADTFKAKAVIDFDTVQAGYLIYDFGDMVRSFCNPVEENSKDLDKVKIDAEKFEAIAEGFFGEIKDQIKPADKTNLSIGIRAIIFMQAVRFLTDYLNGDTYYTINYPEHNLDRCRNQLRLLETYIRQEKDFIKSLNRILK